MAISTKVGVKSDYFDIIDAHSDFLHITYGTTDRHVLFKYTYTTTATGITVTVKFKNTALASFVPTTTATAITLHNTRLENDPANDLKVALKALPATIPDVFLATLDYSNLSPTIAEVIALLTKTGGSFFSISAKAKALLVAGDIVLDRTVDGVLKVTVSHHGAVKSFLINTLT